MTTKKKIEINRNTKIMANPRITLQEEPDRWGLLYDPNIDFSLGMNPTSVFLWKQLENKTTIKDITTKIKDGFSNVPMGIEKEVTQLVKGLMKLEFVTATPDEITCLHHSPAVPGN